MHICIIGNGASGLMAACAFKEKGYVKKITVIGSPHIPTIGVGESTTLSFEEVHLQFEENFSDFVINSDAAVKYGVYYKGWNPGKGWLHYFKTKEQTYNNEIFHFNYGVLLGNKDPNVYIHDIYGKKLFGYANNYQIVYDRVEYGLEYPFSWHFDAGKYIEYMKKLCMTSEKIEMISDTVVDCLFKYENGIESVESVKLSSGSIIKADFYINSSGASSLNENVFKNKYKYLTDVLLTNKAIFLPLKYKNKRSQFHPYTIAKTMKCGWRWITPTYSRIGTGYVFSTNHISVDDAIKEFLEDIGDDSLSPNVIDFVPRYTQSIKTNLCNIGMSNGFLEPLDAPGLSITAGTIWRLWEHFNSFENRNHLINDVHNPNHKWNSLVEDHNQENESAYEFWCGFILNQYKTCHRRDTDFWIDHTSVKWDYYDSLIQNLNNSQFWPDYGASLMFHQTLAARNIQWDTGIQRQPFELFERDADTMHHLDYINAVRDGKISVRMA